MPSGNASTSRSGTIEATTPACIRLSDTALRPRPNASARGTAGWEMIVGISGQDQQRASAVMRAPLVEPGSRFLHHFRGTRQLLRDMARECFRRAAYRYHRLGEQPVLDVLRLHGADDLAIQPVHDRARGARGHKNAVPGARLVIL